MLNVRSAYKNKSPNKPHSYRKKEGNFTRLMFLKNRKFIDTRRNYLTIHLNNIFWYFTAMFICTKEYYGNLLLNGRLHNMMKIQRSFVTMNPYVN